MKRRRKLVVPPSTEELLVDMNPEQVEVIKHHLGPLVVGAVAGAGKTAALVRRIAHLVLEHDVDPARILAVTFSKKAAGEMNDRLALFLPEANEARVGTFHSLTFQFKREELPHMNRWDVDNRDQYRICVKDAISYRGMNWQGADLTQITTYIGLCKSLCALPNTERAKEVAKDFWSKQPCGQRDPDLLVDAYNRAEVIRIDRELITFDDMLLEMWFKLNEDAQCRARWASRWDFVMQDESQDENMVQREIASMLARPHMNYMIVGDPA